MVSQYEGVFKVSKKYTYLRWLTLVLLFPVMIFIAFMIATTGQDYPDLSAAPILCAGLGFIWIPLLVEYWRQTVFVQLKPDQFIIRKWAQTPKQFDYKVILVYNEQSKIDRNGTFNVLTIYLPDNFLIIKSNEFTDYELLKNQLIQYGQPTTYQKVMTLTERNWTRWMIGGLALFTTANIAFGYVAHNPADPKPARLVKITDIIDKINEDRPKSMLKGVRILLRTYPDLSFYVSRQNYDVRLDDLKWAIKPRQPITLLIRESDYRKKMVKSEPLTFGDKYSDYKHILVFGVDQTNKVHLQAFGPVYEPTHTNPLQRTILLSFLLLLCWVGWVYVDRHKVLRAN